MSRLRLMCYRALGLRAGQGNRMEGGGRLRRLRQIVIGDNNAFTQGCWLWPLDEDYAGIRIRIGNSNYFNRNLMIDACGSVEIGDHNMFGPDVYITDSNHRQGEGAAPGELPMQRGRVVIGSRCWIGAKAIILKDVELGEAADYQEALIVAMKHQERIVDFLSSLAAMTPAVEVAKIFRAIRNDEATRLRRLEEIYEDEILKEG